MEKNISRRDFLKASGVAFGALLIPFDRLKNLEIGEIKSGQWFYPAETQILLLPLRKDWTYNDTGEEKGFPLALQLHDRVLLQARDIKDVWVDGVNLKVGEVPATGSKHIAFAILEANGKSFYEPEVFSPSEVLSGFTYTAEAEVYPNKIMNILEGAKNLLAYQETSSGFSDGVDYSFLETQNFIIHDDDFRMGYNSGITAVYAGGICAVSTTLAKSMYALIKTGKAAYVERTLHPEGSQYFGGPSTPEITEAASDATVRMDVDKKWRLDFIWRFQGLGKIYLWAEASLIPNGELWKLKKDWMLRPADARLVLTMSWRKNPPPPSQLEKIKELRDLYELYRDKGPMSAGGQILSKSGFEKVLTWDNAKSMAESVRPELETRDFQAEISGSDNGKNLENIKASLFRTDPKGVFKFHYAFIYYIRDTVNEFNRISKGMGDIGTFLVSKMGRDGILAELNGALPDFENNLLDMTKTGYPVSGRSVSAAGWVHFLGKLGLPVSPIDIGTGFLENPAELLSHEAKEALAGSKTYLDRGRRGMLIARTGSINDVQVGDSFIRYAGNNKNFIGTVIGRKTVGGERVLLVTDADRKEDGVIRVFEVNKNNFRVIFGEGENTPPVVIRNEEVQKYLDGYKKYGEI